LTVTGLLPSPVDQPEEEETQSPQTPSDPILSRRDFTQEQEAIVQDLLRRVRYLLTLKGRPPFRLA
jgi:hypothetical protein